MLNRQKCILYMAERAGRAVSRLELTKWAFLLAREMPSRGGSSFYDFLPYQYGPFSFVLFREAGTLVRDGFLRETTVGPRDAWERVHDVPAGGRSLPLDVRSDAAKVVERFGNTDVSDLIDYVYARFPWYTVNSQIRRLSHRRVRRTGIFTIGYEGCSVDRLLDVLMRKGIERVVDVRQNPVARRYGFHKSTLSRICGELGIDYVHVPEVGIPSAFRRDLDGPAAYARLFAEYEKGLLAHQSDAVAAIARMMVEKPSALMCLEADPNRCHRSRLADAVASVTQLPVRHIQGRTCEPVSN